jgi:glycosyltransferase involved in cell wall biosynthesis
MHIIHIITGLNDGGAEAVLHRLCTHDSANQHAVVSLMDQGKYGPLLRAAGISVHCLDMPRRRITLRGVWRLWRLLRRQQPDVVQTWMYHADLIGGLLGRLAGVSTIVWGVHHTTLEAGKSSRSTILIAKLLGHLSRMVPQRIAVCAHKAFEVHGALGYDTARMRVIPNGYDLSAFAPDEGARRLLRLELGIGEQVPLLGMVGRFDPQKDHANLLVALASLREQGRDFVCVLVGTRIEASNSELMAEICALGLEEHVRLLGRRNDIPAVMNSLDLHILSSAFGEAFPNVLAESMACGTPCVTTDVGDAALIVGDTGWVVPPSNSKALAEAIDAAISAGATPEWETRREGARRRIEEHFGIERMVAAYGAVWRETIA